MASGASLKIVVYDADTGYMKTQRKTLRDVTLSALHTATDAFEANSYKQCDLK